VKGKGCVISAVMNGCNVRFYGWENEKEHELAITAAEQVRAAVHDVLPGAEVNVLDYQSKEGVVVLVRVTGDTVAAFENGPLHKRAIALVCAAASRSMNEGAWSAIRFAPLQ